jgi:hypothetical protein
MSTAPAPIPADLDPRSKGDRTPALMRFPVEVLKAVDTKAAGLKMTRNDALIAAARMWSGMKPDAPTPAAITPKLKTPSNRGKTVVVAPKRRAPSANQPPASAHKAAKAKPPATEEAF